MEHGVDLGKAWAIAASNAGRAARDPRLLFFALAVPVLIIFLVGSIFGSAATKVPVGVASIDRGLLARDLLARLEARPDLKVKTYEDTDTVRREVRRGRMSAGLIVPAGYDSRLRAGSAPELVLITQEGRVETRVVRGAVGDVVEQQAGAVAAAVRDGSRLTAATIAAGDARAGSLPRPGVRTTVLRTGDMGSPAPTPFAYTSASNVVLFTFVNTLAIGGMLAATRRLGLTRRMLATPTSPATIAAGEAAGRFVIALVQAVGLLAVGALVFGVDWGDPAGLAAVVLLFVAMSTAAGLLFGTVLRNEEQAVPIAAPVGIALAMLGGCMWSLEDVSSVVRTVGHVTPHAWAMDAFVVLLNGGGITQLARPLLVLGAFAAVLIAAAAVNLRRTVTRPG